MLNAGQQINVQIIITLGRVDAVFKRFAVDIST